MMTRKLDAAIAEALGYEVIKPRFQDVRDPGGYLHKNVDMWTGDFSYYSTDGNAMLELDREMRVRNYVLFMNRGPDGAVIAYYNKPTNGAINQSELLARALAAYKALTGKEWRE